jgi:hypothetical protein
VLGVGRSRRRAVPLWFNLGFPWITRVGRACGWLRRGSALSSSAVVATLPRLVGVTLFVSVLIGFGLVGTGLTAEEPPPATVLAETPATRIELPPEPPRPLLRGLSPQAIDRARGEWYRALKAWRENLTPEQKAELVRREREGPHEWSLDTPLPDPAKDYRWQDAARDNGQSADEIARLERDKLFIEDRCYKQAFEVYIDNPQPVFITSDSLLNAFHVLFEDSFRELELRRVTALRENLEAVVKQARENSKESRYPMADLAPGWRLAQYVVGPALCILGTPVEFFDADTRAEIERQVALIRAAEAVKLPSWLGPPSQTLLALDYRRCKPVGFYAESERLSDYFRAVRWLQMIPFRADHDDELTAIMLLGNATRGERSLFSGMNDWLGQPDDRDLAFAGRCFRGSFSTGGGTTWRAVLARYRHFLAQNHAGGEWSQVNSEIRLPPAGGDQPAEVVFRVLSASRLRDAVLFQHLADSGGVPEGLAVAAQLGSRVAISRLDGKNKSLVRVFPPWSVDDSDIRSLREGYEVIYADQEGDPRRYRSVYDEYLSVLATLFAPREPDAPVFMDGDVWAAKSCQTALASWAQMRRTFSLQAKLSAYYECATINSPGFIEPNPAFFGVVADLGVRVRVMLERDGAFDRSPLAEAEKLRDDARFLERLGLHKPSATIDGIRELNHEDRARYHLMDWDRAKRPEEFVGITFMSRNGGLTSDVQMQQYHAAWIAYLRATADRIENDEGLSEAKDQELRARWGILSQTARQLEGMSHKQLAGRAWSEEDRAFIRGYGETLGNVMGYFGNTWISPRDDAPRWAKVHRFSLAQGDESLAVGVGRARLLHVLYPWNGGEILCQGAVLPYYEYREKERLTDEEWRAKLDSPDAPPQPDWIEAITVR